MCKFRSWIVLAAVLLGGATVNAQVVPSLTSVTPQGSDYLYTYTVTADANTSVNNGTYFTLYDFYGYAGGATAPSSSWTFTSQGTGTTPSDVAPPDSTGIPNLTWVYTGPSINGLTTVGDFSVLSTQQTTNNGQGFYSYSALESDNGALLDGASTVSTPLVPEPATLGIAAVGLLALRRKR